MKKIGFCLALLGALFADNGENLDAGGENRAKLSYDNKFFLLGYEPNYIGYARDFDTKDDRKQNEIKFQFSFQKPFWEDISGRGDSLSFAYSQTSWWQIHKESMPFRESLYRPELFYTMPTSFSGSKYVRVGVKHESNGKDGVNSRSWNKIYASAKFDMGNLSVTPTIWHSFVLDEMNKDIRQYMGYGDIRAEYKIGRQNLSALVRNNLRVDGKNRGALELGYMFPIFSSPFKGYVQYFSGYGESLADYNKHVDKVMLGIALYE